MISLFRWLWLFLAVSFLVVGPAIYAVLYYFEKTDLVTVFTWMANIMSGRGTLFKYDHNFVADSQLLYFRFEGANLSEACPLPYSTDIMGYIGHTC